MNCYQVMLESLSQLNRNVSLSLPAFWEKEPIVWFKCVDVFFTSRRICKQSKMFDHVLKRLPPKYLALLSDVITECSQSINPYDILKRALISRYTLSEDAQLDKLHKIQLGEMSPIEFLAKLRGSLVSFDHNEPTFKRLIKKVFFESMSVMVRQLLSATGETDVDLLAQKATHILSASPANPPTDDKPQYKVNEYFHKQLGNMSDAVDELNRKLEKFTSDQRNKGSAPTSTISKNGLCFYHNRYGNRAHKCISPCYWYANDAMSHSQKNYLN